MPTSSTGHGAVDNVYINTYPGGNLGDLNYDAIEFAGQRSHQWRLHRLCDPN
jgi:hypothetical protein